MEYRTGATIYTSPAIQIGGNVHIASDDGQLHTINSFGQGLGRSLGGVSALDASPGIAIIGDETFIYIADRDPNGKVYKYNSENMLSRVDFPTDAPILSSPVVDSNGNVYIANDNGSVYKVNASSGDLSQSGKNTYLALG